MRHVRFSSLTRDQTQALCIGSTASYLLDHQRNLQGLRLWHLWDHYSSNRIERLSVQFSSVTQSCLTLCDPQHARPPCPSPTVLPVHHQLSSLSITKSLLKLMSIESVMPFSHLILCHPLLLLPPNCPSIRVFSNESTLCMRWPKYWSFSFSISPSNEHPGLISFRMDWLDFLVVQGTLKSLLQHHSSKASILRHSAFFTVQLSHHT